MLAIVCTMGDDRNCYRNCGLTLVELKRDWHRVNEGSAMDEGSEVHGST